MSHHKVTHVIFDMDGLLLESESVYEKIFTEIAASYGKTFTSQIRSKILGVPEEVCVKIIIDDLQLPISVPEFFKIYREMVKQRLSNPTLMPGVTRLVEHLHENKIPIAVATSSANDSVEVKTQNHKQLFALFHHLVCGSSDEEVKHGKPAPDIFLVCASRFPNNPKPDECLVFEDAPNGVLAAQAAGMQVVFVPSSPENQDLKKPASLVLKSLVDFKPELFGLPPFHN